MKELSKNLALWLVLILMMILLFNMFNQPQPQIEKVIFSDFIAAVEKGDVEEVLIQGNDISGKHKGGKAFKTYTPNDPELIKILREKGVRVSAKPEDQPAWYINILVSWFPMLLLIGVWIFFMKQMQPGGGKAMAFGKSRAKLLSQQQKVTFKDVAGIEEAKEELVEIIQFLKDPQKFTKLGGRIPKGVMLMGTPGSGKDSAGKGHRWGGGSSILFHLRFGLCRDVCRSWGIEGKGPVYTRKEECAVHNIYRRNRCSRSAQRRGWFRWRSR